MSAVRQDAARLRYCLFLMRLAYIATRLNRVGLSVNDDVFEFEIGYAGGNKLVVLDGHIEIFQEDVTDVGLAGVGLDDTEGVERAFDADDLQILDDRLGRFHALKIKILRPRRHLNDAAGGALGGDIAEGDVLVMLGRVGTQL